MKTVKLLIVFIGVFLLSTGGAYSQKRVDEVTLQYNISVESTNEKSDIARSLDGAVPTVFLKPTVSRSEMRSSIGSESNLFDLKTGKGIILKEYSGQKLMITLDKNNWQQKKPVLSKSKFCN